MRNRQSENIYLLRRLSVMLIPDISLPGDSIVTDWRLPRVVIARSAVKVGPTAVTRMRSPETRPEICPETLRVDSLQNPESSRPVAMTLLYSENL